MLCEICQQAAVGKCRSCGTAVCADHGGTYCYRCSSAVVSAEPRRRSSTSAISPTERESAAVSGPGWLQCETSARPSIYIEDPGPPSCHVCQGLARNLCRNCQNLYCSEHAGASELCRECDRSSRVAMIILAIMMLLFVCAMLWVWLRY